MTGLLILGISHKTAPVELRERVALSYGQAWDILAELTGADDIQEAVVLSTCNRTELYVVESDPVTAESTALGIMARRADIQPTDLAEHLYSWRDLDVARHLFRVAAGLESMIIGETEILSQVKRSYETALNEGATGLLMNRLFREAIAAGKRARRETRISEAHVSVSSVAVELAEKVLGDLSRRRVLVIGAGETGELTARTLIERGVHATLVTNRRFERAVSLAQKFGGTAVKFEDLSAELEQADIVIGSTSSPHPLIDHEEMAKVMQARDAQPIFMIDTAVPRDFDPAIRSLPGAHLYDIDDLQTHVEANLSGRESEALRAGAIVEEELERLSRWMDSLEVVPTIAALRDLARRIIDEALAENHSKWKAVTDEDRERIEYMSAAIINKLLHEPTVRMKQAAVEGTAHQYVQAIRDLFALDAGAGGDDNEPDRKSATGEPDPVREGGQSE